MAKQANHMAGVITRLLNKNLSQDTLNRFLSSQCGGVKFENEGYMPLIIDKITSNIISVAHYYIQNGDLIDDPRIDFHFTFYEDQYYWTPISITHPPMMFDGKVIGGRKEVAIVKDGKIEGYYPKQQEEVAIFANKWGRNLQSQGWQRNAKLIYCNIG